MAVKYFWLLNKIHPRGPVHIEKVNSKVMIGELIGTRVSNEKDSSSNPGG